MPESPRTFADIADAAAAATEELTSATTDEGRAAAHRKLDQAYRDAQALNEIDTETGGRALDVVSRFRREAGLPAKPAVPATPAPESSGAPTDQRPQTKSGAGGSPASVAGDHGFFRPEVDGGLIGQLSAQLIEIQKRLCAHLSKEPNGIDDRRGGKSTQEDITWESEYSKLIAEMAAKENELAYNAALTDGGFDESDWNELGKARDHLKQAADALGESDSTRAEAEKMRQQVEDYDKTYKAVAENLVSESAAGDVKKGGSKAKKGVDQAIKGGETAERWARTGTSAADRADKAKRAADLAKLDSKMPTPTKAMSHINKLNPMGQAAGMIGAGFLRMGSLASQLRQLELEKQGSREAKEALDHQREAEAVLGKILDRKIGQGIEVLNKRVAREHGGDNPPLFTLHRHGDTKWDENIAGRVGKYYETELDTTDGRYRPSAELGSSQINRGVPFDRRLFEQWCGSRKVAALGTNRMPLVLVAVTLVGLAVGGAFLLRSGGDSAEETTPTTVAVAVGQSPAVSTVGSTPPETVPESVPETVPESAPEAVPPTAMYATPAAGCATVTHSPLPGSNNPSYFSYWVLVATELGPAPDGTTIEIVADGAAAPIVFDTVGGVGGGDFPISSYGDYPMTVISAASPDGPLEVVDGATFDVVTVGPDEGPVGGCVDPATLSPGERDAAAGGLPFPSPGIVADERDAIPAPDDDLGPYREFLTRFDAAHREGDVDTLLRSLHPAVIARYGTTQCRSSLESTVGSISEIFLTGGQPEPWDYPTDGVTTDIANSWTVSIEATITSDASRQNFDFHLVDAGPPAGVQWFTDCGTPL